MRRKRGDASAPGLRRRAESRLRAKPAAPTLETLSPAQVAAVGQELRVQQVELELQNDELQRTQAELQASWDALALSEERYRQIWNMAPVAHLTLDAEARIEVTNAAAAALLQTGTRSLAGRRFSDFVAPEDQDAWHRRRRALARGEAAPSFALDLRLEDGATVHVELASSSIREAGRQVGLYVVLLDVTERRRAEREIRESEQRVRLLTDSLPVLVSFVDLEERYRFVNAAYETWFGVPQTEFRGRTVRQVIGDEAYAAVAPHIAVALTGESTSFDGEVPYRNAGRRFVRISYTPYAREDGAVRGFYCVILDLTALRRTEQALRAAAAEAALAEERERRKLAGDLHDDVAQLLSLSSMKLRALEDSRDAREQERLRKELAGLVTVARERVSSLSFQLSPSVLQDVGLVAAAEWLAEDMERSYGLAVRISAEAELGGLDDAMSVTLFRALRELLINVSRHSGCTEACARITRDGGEAVVEVEDRGVGFDPASGSGGFGLISLRDRVQHLGGSVWIDSAPGRGTKVLVRAPYPGSSQRGSPEP